MKRTRFIDQLTDAISMEMGLATTDSITLVRRGAGKAIPRGAVVAILTEDQATALYEAVQYRLEFAGEGDHSHVLGQHAAMLRRACAALGV